MFMTDETYICHMKLLFCSILFYLNFQNCHHLGFWIWLTSWRASYVFVDFCLTYFSKHFLFLLQSSQFSKTWYIKLFKKNELCSFYVTSMRLFSQKYHLSVRDVNFCLYVTLILKPFFLKIESLRPWSFITHRFLNLLGICNKLSIKLFFL